MHRNRSILSLSARDSFYHLPSHKLRSHGLVCLAVMVMAPSLVLASSPSNWTGAAGSDWQTGDNWDNGVPTLGNVAHIENATGNPVILSGTAAVDGLVTGAVSSLYLQPAAILQTAALTNAGTILLGGTLDLQGAGSFQNSGTLSLVGGTITGSTLNNSGTIQTVSGVLGRLGAGVNNTGTIEVSDNSDLQLTGGSTYTNDGQITLNATVNSDLRVVGGGTVTLGGSGTLSMSNSLGNNIAADTPGMTLINGISHHISGSGVVGGPSAPFTLQNEGTITASGSAGMIFAPAATLVNQGTIEAAGGSTLTFVNGVANTGGTIRADGGTATFQGMAPVLGGRLEVAGGGSMSFASSSVQDAFLDVATNSNATLTGSTYTGGSINNQGTLLLQSATVASSVTNSGTIQNASGGLSQLGGPVTNIGTIEVLNGSVLQLTGGSTYTNDGQITLNATGSNSDLRVVGGGTVTLGGSGKLSMSDSLGNNIAADTPGMTLVNGAGHHITGSGVFGGPSAPFTLQNEGTITASGNAGIIFAPAATLMNQGTIQTTGGSRLTFVNGVANTGGTIRADGGTATFDAMGLVSAISGGSLQVTNGGSMMFLRSQVQGASLDVAAGSGAVLTDTTCIGGSINNQGTLVLQGATVSSAVTNSGTIQNAIGQLSRLGGTVSNTGTIEISNGSALQLTGGSTYTNDGRITLNSTGSTSDLRLVGGGTVTLGGSGKLSMSDSLGNNVAADTPGMTLVNGSGHHITGSGVIGGPSAPFTLQNEGTITASGNAGMVFAPAATLVNQGTIQTTGGSMLQFFNGVANTGGTIRADGGDATFQSPAPVLGGSLDVTDGGSMMFFGSQVQGASLAVATNSSAALVTGSYTGGSINNQGTLILQSSTVSSSVTNSGTIWNVSEGTSQLGGTVTNTGAIEVSNGSALQVTGGSTYTNNGQIKLNSTGSTSDLRLVGGGTVTLGGSGSLSMTDSLGNNIAADTPGMTLINGSGHHISGSGVIGGSSAPFTLQNEGTIRASGNAGMIFAPAATVINHGKVETAGGSIQAFARFENAGTVVIASGTTFSAFDPTTPMSVGYAQTGGSTVVNGSLLSSVMLDGGSLSGDGMVAGSLFNTGGSINPGNSPGSLDIGGDFIQGPGGILTIEIGPSGWDVLNIAGHANFGGRLRVVLAPGFVPQDDTWYTIALFNGHGGSQFVDLRLPTYRCEVDYSDTQLAFHYLVPEPTTALLLAAGLAVAGLRRRRR